MRHWFTDLQNGDTVYYLSIDRNKMRANIIKTKVYCIREDTPCITFDDGNTLWQGEVFVSKNKEELLETIKNNAILSLEVYKYNYFGAKRYHDMIMECCNREEQTFDKEQNND